MSSAVYFKMGWEKDMSKVTFSGNQIKLRDLKDQIIELRNLKNGAREWAFDLIVKDAADNSKGFHHRMIDLLPSFLSRPHNREWSGFSNRSFFLCSQNTSETKPWSRSSRASLWREDLRTDLEPRSKEDTAHLPFTLYILLFKFYYAFCTWSHTCTLLSSCCS